MTGGGGGVRGWVRLVRAGAAGRRRCTRSTAVRGAWSAARSVAVEVEAVAEAAEAVEAVEARLLHPEGLRVID